MTDTLFKLLNTRRINPAKTVATAEYGSLDTIQSHTAYF